MADGDNKEDTWKRRKMANLTSQPAYPDSNPKETKYPFVWA
jgi:hypothetical protein